MGIEAGWRAHVNWRGSRQRRRSYACYPSGESKASSSIQEPLTKSVDVLCLGRRLRNRKLHQAYPHCWSGHYLFHPTALARTGDQDSSGAKHGNRESYKGARTHRRVCMRGTRRGKYNPDTLFSSRKDTATSVPIWRRSLPSTIKSQANGSSSSKGSIALRSSRFRSTLDMKGSWDRKFSSTRGVTQD